MVGFSILLKVEIRIKTKNGIEDIIKRIHGENDRGKKFQQMHAPNLPQSGLWLIMVCWQ